jgi:LPXTG-motif cell wall-anchored protein
MISSKPAVLSIAVLLGLSLSLSLNADQWNKKTVLTVKESIQLPHTVLEPGTYVFKLADSLSDRHIVQIFSADETHVIATILAIPNYRLKPAGKSVFQFWETPAGNPKAMRAWFYPGDNFGQEFAYPKMKSIEIAKITRAPVPTVLVEKEVVDVEVLKTAPIVIVTEKGEEKPLVLMAQNTVAQSEPEAAYQRPEIASATAAKTLPHTASSLPLIALAGLALLAAFGLITYFSNRKPRLDIETTL